MQPRSNSSVTIRFKRVVGVVRYRWNDVFGNTEKIRSMVDRLRFQVECFNEALPYEAGQSYGDRAASQVRVIYRIS